MIKILAIGNSYSQDATSMIELLDKNIMVRNLYIGGCSLEMHYDNIKNDLKNYRYEELGGKEREENISIKEALEEETWDYVTIQQVSSKSGMRETFEPYIDELIRYVKKFSNAEIILHETWAYNNDTTHPGFINYDNSEKKMYESIVATYEYYSKKYNLRIIPTGYMIEELRKTDIFNKSNGGLDLCRDEWQHLSLNYGRLAASSLWVYFFTGKIPSFFDYANSLPVNTIKDCLLKAKII